ncbi:hypothetical protein E4V51_18230 [Paenibacillus sp. 28ISP30-2]|nr:hypothetical protein [Paenibacillus sp. 28ISP30-2]
MKERTTKIIVVKGIAFEVDPVVGIDGLYAAYSERNGVAVEYDVNTGFLAGKGSRKYGEAVKAGIHRAIELWNKDEQRP